MKAKFKTANPDDIEMTLEITMTISEWQKLKSQLRATKYPSNDLFYRIMDMIELAEMELKEERES